jgi:hypothetical protein
VGYPEAPCYTWEEAEQHGTLSWYDVCLMVPPHPERPLWHGWGNDSNGQTPWEGAQVAALVVLMDICQNFGDELLGGPATSIACVAPLAIEWNQDDGRALVRGHGE